MSTTAMAVPLTASELARLDATSLACTAEFQTDGWRDPVGRDLYDVLAAELGRDRAADLWRETCDAYDRMRHVCGSDCDCAENGCECAACEPADLEAVDVRG